MQRISKQSSDPALPHIEYENIQSGLGKLNTSLVKLHSNKKGILFRKNDILFGKLRPYLKNWYLAGFNGIAVGDFWVLRSNKYLFIYYLIQTPRFFSISNVSTGSKMPRSDWNLVANYNFLMPGYDEAEVIGKTIHLVDSIIYLQQKKLEQLRTLKKFLLQNLFAVNVYPQIRFKGFNDPWELRKLGNIVTLEDNKRSPVTKLDRIPGNTPYYGANGIQDHVEGHTHTGEHVLVAEDGANSVTNYPVYFIYQPSWINNHSHVLTGKKGIIINSFLAYDLKKVNYTKYLVGSGRYKLNAETLKTITLKIPLIDEQNTISLVLSTTDKLIHLQHCKFAKLKSMKKFLLQKLFI